MNVLAIDYGDRWLGLAIGNREDLVVAPLSTIDRTETADFFAALRLVCEAESIDQIVVGLPTTLRGEAGERAQTVHAFVRDLTATLSIPIDLVDERFTSHLARQNEVTGGDEHSRAAAALLDTYFAQQHDA